MTTELGLAFASPEGIGITLPPEYTVGWIVSLLVHVGVLALAVRSMIRHRDLMSFGGTAVWVAVLLFFPLIGALLWFLVGRPREQLLVVPPREPSLATRASQRAWRRG